MAIDQERQDQGMNEILLVSPPLRVPCCEPWFLHPVNSCLHQRGAKNDLAEGQDAQWLFSREVKPTRQQIGSKLRQDEIWAGAAGMPRFSLYVNIFTSPLDQGLSRAEPARYELPGKDLVLHTA
jgi:hypothetical protein